MTRAQSRLAKERNRYGSKLHDQILRARAREAARDELASCMQQDLRAQALREQRVADAAAAIAAQEDFDPRRTQ